LDCGESLTGLSRSDWSNREAEIGAVEIQNPTVAHVSNFRTVGERRRGKVPRSVSAKGCNVK
jgi:hypothetical protein